VTETLSPVMIERHPAWHYDVLEFEFDDIRRAVHAVGATLDVGFPRPPPGPLPPAGVTKQKQGDHDRGRRGRRRRSLGYSHSRLLQMGPATCLGGRIDPTRCG
jgi:hypothetical protein